MDGWLDTDWRRETAAIKREAAALAVVIEGETRKRLAAGDDTPVRIVDVVEHVALPLDDDAVAVEIEAQAAEAAAVVEAPITASAEARTGFPSTWGGWAPRQHTVVRKAEAGVVGGGRTATVWEPEFGSLFD